MEPTSFDSRAVGDGVTVHRYTQSERGFLANAYLVETDDGVISIDTVLPREDGERLAGHLDSLGKPLSAVFYTHAHPEHYLWTELLTGGEDVPIYTTPELKSRFHAVDADKRERWTPIYGDDYAPETQFPTDTVPDGTSVEVAGAEVIAHHMGDGEGPDMAVYTLDTLAAAFLGDVLMAGIHAYFGEGESEGWLRQVSEARDLVAPDWTLFPGHGDPAGMAALDFQAAYVVAYQEAVRNLADEAGRLDEAAVEELHRRMVRVLPEAPMSAWVYAGAHAVAAELSGREWDPDTGGTALKEFMEAHVL